MSQTPEPSQPAPLSLPPSRPRRRLVARILLAAALLLGVWIGWQEMPREIARWYLAAAVEHRSQASFDRIHDRKAQADVHRRAAQTAMEQSLAWDPHSAEALATRANWHRAEGRLQDALDDCNRAIAVAGKSDSLLEQRSLIYMEMKRFEEAVADQQAIFEPMRSWSWLERWWLADAFASQLNTVAYFRAVG